MGLPKISKFCRGLKLLKKDHILGSWPVACQNIAEVSKKGENQNGVKSKWGKIEYMGYVNFTQ